jgi:hypothetical protein
MLLRIPVVGLALRFGPKRSPCGLAGLRSGKANDKDKNKSKEQERKPRSTEKGTFLMR